jgi:hypothetical protein
MRATLIVALLQPLLVAQTALPGVKPIPRVQAVPEPYDQISFRRDEKEIARYQPPLSF